MSEPGAGTKWTVPGAAAEEIAAVSGVGGLFEASADEAPTATRGVRGLVEPPPAPLKRSLSAVPSYLLTAPPATFAAPAGPAVVIVTAVGEAEGSRGAAAALARAGAAVDVATLLVEVGGRPPRPTLIASAAARKLEERLAAHLPQLRVAARGEVCQAAVAADEDGLAAASAAVTVARAGAVVHVEAEMLQPVLAAAVAPRPGAALLRADLDRDRPLVALAVADLLERDLRVGVLKRRLGWVAERRAGFGALGSDGGLPAPLVRRLLG